MNITLQFKDLASPSEGKPKGCYEKVGDVYVSLWMGWVLEVSDTREGGGNSIVIYNFDTKPTSKMIREVKKMVW